VESPREGGRQIGAASMEAGAYLRRSCEVPARRVERASVDGGGSCRGEHLQKRSSSGRGVAAEARGEWAEREGSDAATEWESNRLLPRASAGFLALRRRPPEPEVEAAWLAVAAAVWLPPSVSFVGRAQSL
jgi:hypothetical protein